MLGMTTVRTISSGKSAQFPVTGTIASSYHTVGAEIVGTAVNHNEKIINIDDMLLSHAFIAEIDELKNHWDARSVYSKEMGRALSNKVDQHLCQLMVLASQASATVTGGNGGTQITDADAKTNATSLIASVFDFTTGIPATETTVPVPKSPLFLEKSLETNLSTLHNW